LAQQQQMQELDRLLNIVGQILCGAEFICQIRCRESRKGGNFLGGIAQQVRHHHPDRRWLKDFHRQIDLTHYESRPIAPAEPKP
jgi:hypothetical protein